MRSTARIGMAIVGAVALVLAGCNNEVSGPAGGLTARAAKGGNHGGGHGGGGGGGGATYTPTVVTFSDAAGDGITSDGLGSYADGTCGVLADFNLQDARLDPDANWSGKFKHSCTQRYEHFHAVDASGGTVLDTNAGAFMNIDHVEDVAPGTTELNHAGTFDLQANLAHCNVLHFDGTGGSGLLEVSRSADGSTWTVSTSSANPTAYCASEGGLVTIPFSFTVQLQ